MLATSIHHVSAASSLSLIHPMQLSHIRQSKHFLLTKTFLSFSILLSPRDENQVTRETTTAYIRPSRASFRCSCLVGLDMNLTDTVTK
jgi:hypothetical protein